MSGLNGKTPAESYKDLLTIGSSYNGLTSEMSSVTDGAGQSSTVKASLHSVDIDFNGGSIGSILYNNFSGGYKLNRIEYSSTNSVYVGNPGAQFFMPMFYSVPDPGAVVPCNPDGAVNNCRRITLELRAPVCKDPISAVGPYSVYSCTDVFLYTDANPVRFDFTSPDGYDIIGVNTFHPTSRGFDLLRVQMLRNDLTDSIAYYVSLIGEDVFGLSISEPPTGSLKLLCESTWNLYPNDYRKGETIKAAVPLSKAAPGGSYKDLLYLNNNNNGLHSTMLGSSNVNDGLGNETNIELTTTGAGIYVENCSLTDPILSSNAVQAESLLIVDATTSYTLDSAFINNIIINRSSNLMSSETFYLTIDLNSMPSYETTNPNEKNSTQINFSYKVNCPDSQTILNVRFLMNENYTDWAVFSIPASDAFVCNYSQYLIIYSDSIEEVVAI
jgi:hypothetical protein